MENKRKKHYKPKKVQFSRKYGNSFVIHISKSSKSCSISWIQEHLLHKSFDRILPMLKLLGESSDGLT